MGIELIVLQLIDRYKLNTFSRKVKHFTKKIVKFERN